jgi:hypothetical protein
LKGFFDTHTVRRGKMKKAFDRVVFAFVVLLLCSCSGMLAPSDLGVYDKTVPANQLALLYIPAYYTVNLFDGKEVGWTGGELIPTGAEILIPPGTHEFEYRYDKPQTGGCTAGAPQQSCSVSRGFRTCYQTTQRTCTPVVPARAFDGKASATIEAGKNYQVNEKDIGLGKSPFSTRK